MIGAILLIGLKKGHFSFFILIRIPYRCYFDSANYVSVSYHKLIFYELKKVVCEKMEKTFVKILTQKTLKATFGWISSAPMSFDLS